MSAESGQSGNERPPAGGEAEGSRDGAAGGFVAWPEQDENGVDLTLIREALRLTPEQRLRRMDRARRSALRLQRSGQEARARRRGEQSD